MKHAQDGRGAERPPKGQGRVSSLMVARIRALCANPRHGPDKKHLGG